MKYTHGYWFAFDRTKNVVRIIKMKEKESTDYRWRIKIVSFLREKAAVSSRKEKLL